MPFINDRLEENDKESVKQDYLSSVSRVSRFVFDPKKIDALLRQRIVGQDQVLEEVEDLLYRVKADFGESNRPLSIMLFLGSTGVGKTETTRILADSILGSADKLCRIDMNTLAQAHYSAAITGSPPGYVGSKEGQTLFSQEKILGSFSKPGIVLFDEIEKADQSVVNALLNIFDTGKLKLSSGDKELDFSNCMIFMTSNLGVKELSEQIKVKNKSWMKLISRFSSLFFKELNQNKNSNDALLDQALHQHFQPEFLNRIDSIIAFNSLDKKLMKNLIEIEIKKLNTRLNKKNASIAINPELSKYFEKSYDPRFGARDIARNIRKQLEPKIAKAVLNHPESNQFTASINDNSILIKPNRLIEQSNNHAKSA